MKKFFAVTLAVLAIMSVLALPAFAEEAETKAAPVTEAVTEAVDETVDEAVTETVTEVVTEHITETEAVTETETETETETAEAVPFDEWLYNLLKDASPEEVEIIEEIVLGGVGALDNLGIKGFDRFRVWVEHNMATVLTILIIAALVAFFVVTVLQKRSFSKKADVLNDNAIEMYEAGQAAMKEAAAVCDESVAAAREAAEEAKKAVGMVTEERAMLVAEIKKSEQVIATQTEMLNFLLQCSDLSARERDEAQAIAERMEALTREDGEDHDKA
jgi:hypothetical protein